MHNGFFEHERTTEFHIAPAEDFDFTPYKNSVDLIFTSPPYMAKKQSYYMVTVCVPSILVINDLGALEALALCAGYMQICRNKLD